MRLLLFIVITIFLTGCATIGNLLIEPEQGFKDYVDSMIGQTIDKVPGTDELDPKSGESIMRLDDKFDEYILSYPIQCMWAAKVERTSKKIVSWRYVSTPSLCKRDKFYAGAW